MKKIIISIIASITIVFQINSQSLPFNIEYSRNDQEQIPVKSFYNSWDGTGLNPIGNYRILNIFINIIYDQTPSANPVNENQLYSTWQRNPNNINSINIYPPSYLQDFLDVDYTTPNNVHGYQTRLMHESSFGNFIITGDFVVVNILQSFITPNSSGSNFNLYTLIPKVINLINNSGGLTTIYGHNQSTEYDSNSDGKFDFIQIFLRNTTTTYGGLNDGQGYGGLYCGSFVINCGNLSLQSGLGTIQCIGTSDLKYGSRIVTHELCHNLFGSNDFHTSGGNHYLGVGTMSFLSIMGGYGLMGCYNSGLVGCNAYERQRMHWKSSTYNTSNYYIAVNNQNSDISKTDGNKSFILRDFVTTGDAIRIKLPYKDANASDQYIWLENHKIGTNNKLDFLQHSDFAGSCRPKGSPGVYAYYQVGRDVLSSSNYSDVWHSYDSDNLRIISAEGNWDYSLLANTQNDHCNWVASKPTKRILSNPFNGNNDQEFIYANINLATNQLHGTNNTVYTRVNYYNSTDFNDSIPSCGDDRDAFTGNSEISLSTNPSIVNSVTFYNNSQGGNINPINSSVISNNRKNYLSGLKISMSQLTNGDYKVDIIWDDYNVKNNVRWTGDIVLKEKLILNNNKTITLDQNLTPNKHIRDAISGYFTETTLFTSENGSSLIQNNNSIINVTNKSKLLLKSGSYYEINDGATLNICENSFLEIEDCATLVIKGSGKLKCLLNGTLCIHPNAKIVIDNQNNIELQQGYLTGSCLPVNSLNFLSLLLQPNSYVISSNVQWNNPIYNITKDVTIENNGVLIINNSTLSINEINKIIVKQGGKLILNGSILTGACGNMWQGIEVWGTSNQPQNSVLNSPYQGIVELKNGAVIENAENAITLWHPGYWNSMGGIVYANNATFLNNRRSIEFMAYQNTTPNGNPVRNLSQFSNCTFKVDDNYRGGSSNPFSHHVTLWAVNGVFFTACNFLNEQSNKVYDPYNNKAIYSIDAGYTVTGSCSSILMYGQTCPDEYLSKSYFKGFNYAIYAMGAGTQNVVKVDETVFEENVYGVQYNSLDNSWVNRSEFKIGNSNIVNSPNRHEGIVTISSTGFRIEENNLQASSISVPNTIGIRVNNSSVNISNANNQIYKNTLSNLNIGEQAEGINRDPNNAYNGLKILCNTHTNNNTNDIAVFSNNSSSGGICMYQGSSVPPLSAGNLFSGINCDYRNAAPWGILYHHTGGATKPNICGNIGLSEIQVANTCPSNFNNGYGFPLSAVSKQQLSAEYTVNESAYINLLYNYNNLIDGGNKNWLLEKIEMSWPQDAWDLRAELLSHSPYLSEEILRETAMKGILPQAMLLEICLANPDGTRNEEFLRFLGEKIPNPLPQYMLDLIYANRDIKTARTLLETNLSAVNSKMAYISGLLISDCMSDSTQLKTEARSWLLRRASLADYYSVAESYIENNDFTSANATADQIINIFELNEEQQAEFQNFRNYIEFRRSISESGRSIMQLQSSEIGSLQQIANATTGRTSAMAQNILCFGYQLCVDYLPADGDGNHLKFTKPEKTAKQILQSAYNKITVTPNPANVYVAFNYELPLLGDNAVIYITDAIGKTITQKSISSKKGQWVWDTRNINKGIYFYEIKTAAESYGNGKIVISK